MGLISDLLDHIWTDLQPLKLGKYQKTNVFGIPVTGLKKGFKSHAQPQTGAYFC